jgi:hypothetical protein
MKTSKQHFENIYIDETGEYDQVVRWVSNDTVPPLEILTELFVAGYITREIHFDSLAVRKIEDAKFLEQYIANRQKYGYSDEEKFEMRAAFGDEEVVDIFTGERVVF